MLSEFDLIAEFFTKPTQSTTLGIGDDCALLDIKPGMHTAISCDMLVSGTHFFADTDPKQLGHKSLAVNLSDLAAMGAKPVAYTLALALPESDKTWLKSFSEGLFELAGQYHCELIGGDTTRGPLNICITIFGEIPVGQALRRDNAKPGDDIWVSGTLGDARLGLAALRKEIPIDSTNLDFALKRLQMPSPRVELGMALRNVAHAAIDISDGLMGDLSHILKRSQVGATLNIDTLPASSILTQLPDDFRLHCMLAGGDDYELCFTAPYANRNLVLKAVQHSGIPVTRIGTIEHQTGLRLVDDKGTPKIVSYKSFDHFQEK